MAEQEIRALLGNVVDKAHREKQFDGLLGRLNSDDSITLSTGRNYYVYVRIIEHGQVRSTIPVLNKTVANVPNMPVIIKENKDKILEVMEIDPLKINEFLNENSPNVFAPKHNHSLDGGSPDFVESMRILEGLVHISDGLTIIIEPIHNVRYNGIDNYYSGETIDLTSYIPTTSGYHRWVKIFFDPSTLSANITAGDEISNALPLDPEALFDISISSPAVPLMGIQLTYGQTEISLYNFFDCRPWLFNNQSIAAPYDAKYIIQTTDVDLPNAQVLASLTTGLLKNTTTTGVLVIATAGTDYVTPTGTETLTNKTITSGKYNEILDTNGNQEITFTATASAVNEVNLANAATGNAPKIEAHGDNTNINLEIGGKGTGDVKALTPLDMNDKQIKNALYQDFKDTTEPSSPSAGYLRLFSLDGKMQRKNSAGDLVDLETGGGSGGSGGSGGAPAVYPIKAWMFHENALSTAGSSFVTTHDASQNYGYVVGRTSPANADIFTNSFLLKRGTYNFYVEGVAFIDRGKIDWYIDDVAIATGQDWYDGGGAYNVVKTVSSVTITNNGRHVLKGVINGKNGSSSGYQMYLSNYWLSPAADTSEYDTATGFISGVYDARATIWRDEFTVTIGNATAANHDASQDYGTLPYQNPAANGDSMTSSVVLVEGTYDFYVSGISGPSYAIIDWYIDDVLALAGQDWYSGGYTYNTIKTGTVTITNSGRHKIKAVVNGKTGSSYNILITKAWFKPTSDSSFFGLNSSGATATIKRAMMMHTDAIIISGASPLYVDNGSGNLMYFRAFQLPSANGDSFTNSCYISAGTYTFKVWGEINADRAKLDWYLDEESTPFISGQDWYGGAQTHTYKSGTVTIGRDGMHKFRAVVNGKNASSSNYYMVLQYYALVPANDVYIPLNSGTQKNIWMRF